MAKVTSTVKRIQVVGEITLTMTPEEAILLRALLGRTCGGGISSTLYGELGRAGVPSAHLSNSIIDFLPDCAELIQKAMNGW